MDGRAVAIALEAHDHALYIAELARDARAGSEIPTGSTSLDETILLRVSQLTLGARAVMVVLALTARPIPETAATCAAAVDPVDLAQGGRGTEAASAYQRALGG